MTKRKLDKISGHDPWKVEVAALIERGIDPDVAWATVAIRWMRRGDLRPLAAFPMLDGAVLDELRKSLRRASVLGLPSSHASARGH
jgi:hypothetical protein